MPHGIYAHPEHRRGEDGFRGWGRVITDFDTGEWGFETVKPGGVIGPGRHSSWPRISTSGSWRAASMSG
jgi:protocatechuate 3,4-dioxygenase alpha subunit